MNGDVMNMLSSVMQDPKAMEKAISMARALSSSGILDGMGAPVKEDTPNNAVPNESAKSISDQIANTSAINAKGNVSMDQRLALLCAIRPYLAKDKAEKLDWVIGILKVISMMENSGIKLF